jgi:hypothetical protein
VRLEVDVLYVLNADKVKRLEAFESQRNKKRPLAAAPPHSHESSPKKIKQADPLLPLIESCWQKFRGESHQSHVTWSHLE